MTASLMLAGALLMEPAAEPVKIGNPEFSKATPCCQGRSIKDNMFTALSVSYLEGPGIKYGTQLGVGVGYRTKIGAILTGQVIGTRINFEDDMWVPYSCPPSVQVDLPKQESLGIGFGVLIPW